jgi:hypothetical protein
MAIKAWDAYVQEASRPSVDIELPDGTHTVAFPTGDQLQRFNNHRYMAQEEEALEALFGEELGKKLIALAKASPAGVLGPLIQDVLVEWGMASSPNPDTSSS